jgi:hypothetical protein
VLPPRAGLGSLKRSPRRVRAEVQACAGPRSGGAGDYQCTLRTRRRTLSLTVDVKTNGTWSAILPANPHSRARGVSMIWGGLLDMPGK